MKFTLKQFFNRSVALGATGAFFVALSASGSPVPGNLGSGLDVLVRERLAQQSVETLGKRGGTIDQQLTAQAREYRESAFTNEEGQVKVYIHLAPRDAKASWK